MTSKVLIRPARTGDEHGICRVCEAGFRMVASELLPPDVVDRQVAAFYRPERVAGEVDSEFQTRAWNGYVVAEQSVRGHRRRGGRRRRRGRRRTSVRDLSR